MKPQATYEWVNTTDEHLSVQITPHANAGDGEAGGTQQFVGIAPKRPPFDQVEERQNVEALPYGDESQSVTVTTRSAQRVVAHNLPRLAHRRYIVAAELRNRFIHRDDVFYPTPGATQRGEQTTYVKQLTPCKVEASTRLRRFFETIRLAIRRPTAQDQVDIEGLERKIALNVAYGSLLGGTAVASIADSIVSLRADNCVVTESSNWLNGIAAIINNCGDSAAWFAIALISGFFGLFFLRKAYNTFKNLQLRKTRSGTAYVMNQSQRHWQHEETQPFVDQLSKQYLQVNHIVGSFDLGFQWEWPQDTPDKGNGPEAWDRYIDELVLGFWQQCYNDDQDTPNTVFMWAAWPVAFQWTAKAVGYRRNVDVQFGQRPSFGRVGAVNATPKGKSISQWHIIDHNEPVRRSLATGDSTGPVDALPSTITYQYVQPRTAPHTAATPDPNGKPLQPVIQVTPGQQTCGVNQATWHARTTTTTPPGRVKHLVVIGTRGQFGHDLVHEVAPQNRVDSADAAGADITSADAASADVQPAPVDAEVPPPAAGQKSRLKVTESLKTPFVIHDFRDGSNQNVGGCSPIAAHVNTSTVQVETCVLDLRAEICVPRSGAGVGSRKPHQFGVDDYGLLAKAAADWISEQLTEITSGSGVASYGHDGGKEGGRPVVLLSLALPAEVVPGIALHLQQNSTQSRNPSDTGPSAVDIFPLMVHNSDATKNKNVFYIPQVALTITKPDQYEKNPMVDANIVW